MPRRSRMRSRQTNHEIQINDPHQIIHLQNVCVTQREGNPNNSIFSLTTFREHKQVSNWNLWSAKETFLNRFCWSCGQGSVYRLIRNKGRQLWRVNLMLSKKWRRGRKKIWRSSRHLLWTVEWSLYRAKTNQTRYQLLHKYLPMVSGD